METENPQKEKRLGQKVAMINDEINHIRKITNDLNSMKSRLIAPGPKNESQSDEKFDQPQTHEAALDHVFNQLKSLSDNLQEIRNELEDAV